MSAEASRAAGGAVLVESSSLSPGNLTETECTGASELVDFWACITGLTDTGVSPGDSLGISL